MRDESLRWALARIVPLRDATGAIREWVGTVTDVHHQKVARPAWSAAYTDRLTGLPNRARLADIKAQALTWAERTGTSVALVHIDLDNFKDVNEALGHEAGDALLIGVARLLRACASDKATVVRLGGVNSQCSFPI